MPSLTPRRNRRVHSPILHDDAAFTHPIRVRLPGFHLTRLPLRSLSLRPGGLLTALITALSTGFKRSIALALAVQATRLLALVMVCLLPYWMHLPCLDAHRKGGHDHFVSNNRRSGGFLPSFRRRLLLRTGSSLSAPWRRHATNRGHPKGPASVLHPPTWQIRRQQPLGARWRSWEDVL